MTIPKTLPSDTAWANDVDTLYPVLKHKLKRAGCFDPVPAINLRDMTVVVAAYAAGFSMLLADWGMASRVLAILILTGASAHAGYIAHDGSHGIITRRRPLARLLGHVFLTFLTGLNYDEFLSKHRRHHSHCNEKAIVPEGRKAVFSLREEVIENRLGEATSAAGVMRSLFNRYQAYLIWFLVSFKGSIVKLDGFRFALENRGAGPMYPIFLALHLALWFGLPVYVLGAGDALVNYLLVTWISGFYIGTVFLLNHFATRIIRADQRPHYFEQQIVTTRNLGSTRLDDFLFGGFNNHLEHHLFPTMPKSKLPRARRITREFCCEHGIPYREMSFTTAIREIFRQFNALATEPAAAV